MGYDLCLPQYSSTFNVTLYFVISTADVPFTSVRNPICDEYTLHATFYELHKDLLKLNAKINFHANDNEWDITCTFMTYGFLR